MLQKAPSNPILRDLQDQGTKFAACVDLLIDKMDELDKTMALGSSSAELVHQLHVIVDRCGEARVNLEGAWKVSSWHQTIDHETGGSVASMKATA